MVSPNHLDRTLDQSLDRNRRSPVNRPHFSDVHR